MTELPPPTFIPATPNFEPPGLSIRATFLASDGSRPQEIILEWKHDPGRATLEFALDKIAELARPSEVEIAYEQQLPGGPEMNTTRAGGPFDGLTGDGRPLREEDVAEEVGWAQDTEQVPRPFCDATGPGHERENGHACGMWAGHDPIEPDGRAHRCRCGGLFAATEEVPDVPGRREQERRRERER